MKKPLILLVDDDRAVLNALEAELAPVFEEICRIEAFDDPGAVLEALPRWTEERRSIAVAIVDQMMPGMSGVEVIATLRGDAVGVPGPEPTRRPTFHPTAHLHAILLTGYGGLDSALAAKNDAGVERYLEKPWTSHSLATAVRQLLGDHLVASGGDAHFVFRPVATLAELLEHWRLRHDVYSGNSTTAHFEVGRSEELDADEYDARSDLWSLFECGSERIRTVGTMRFTWPTARPQGDLVRKALVGHPLLQALVNVPSNHVLPMSGYLPDWPAVEELIREALVRGERVKEGGRFALAANLRNARAGLHLARHCIETSVGLAVFLERLENSLLSCVVAHSGLYKGYGFRECAGTTTRYDSRFNTAITCLHLRPEWLSPAAKRATAARAIRFQHAEGCCQCASYPACLPTSSPEPSPYETGDFRSMDVFCPLRATEIVGSNRPDATTAA